MDSIITTVRRCMQRGGEPLSVINLIEKDLLGIDQAAWLVSRIEQGSSWLVGALPSEAGKTTLMSALLLFLPDREKVTLAHPGARWKSFGPNTCVVTEEISDHYRGCYLWNEDVPGLTAVPAQGGRITSTIHADTLEEAREQVARQCAAGEAGLASFGMFIPIEVSFANDPPKSTRKDEGGDRHRSIRSRAVQQIHYYDGRGWKTIDREIKLTAKQKSIVNFLSQCRESGTHSCEAVRKAWLAHSGC